MINDDDKYELKYKLRYVLMLIMIINIMWNS